jgi:hypothetical protein
LNNEFNWLPDYMAADAGLTEPLSRRGGTIQRRLANHLLPSCFLFFLFSLQNSGSCRLRGSTRRAPALINLDQ